MHLTLDYATHVDDGFTLAGLPGGYTHIQFSLNWLADNSDDNFQLLDGQGERVNDAAALGGGAFRLVGGSGSAMAWSWATSPFGKAAVRCLLPAQGQQTTVPARKLPRSRSTTVRTRWPTRQLLGSDFAVAGQYPGFAVPFTPSDAGNGLIVLFVRRSGASDIFWDSTSLYTPPAPVSDPYTFVAPNRYYRSSGVQVRLVTPGASDRATTSFSDPLVAYPHIGGLEDGGTTSPVLRVSPASLVLSTPSDANPPPDAQVALTCAGCGAVTWEASSDAAWLQATIVDGQLWIHADPAALDAGVHNGTVTLAVTGRPDIAPVTLPVSLIVGNVESLFPSHLYMPAIVRR